MTRELWRKNAPAFVDDLYKKIQFPQRLFRHIPKIQFVLKLNILNILMETHDIRFG